MTEPTAPRYSDLFEDVTEKIRLHCVQWTLPEEPGRASATDVQPRSRDVLMLHGAYQTCHTWDDFVGHLVLEDTRGTLRAGGIELGRLFAADLRGHGDSSHSTGDYAFDTMVSDVARLIELLHLSEESLVLVGMSLGGLISLELAARMPRLSGLVVVDVTPTVAEEGKVKLRRNMSASKELSSFEDYVDWAQKVQPQRPRERLRDRLRHALRQTPQNTWTWRYDSTFDGLGTAEQSMYLWERLDRIKCPVLLVRGSASKITTPELCTRLVEGIGAKARYIEIAEAGHSVQGDRPGNFCDAVVGLLTERAASP